MDKLAYISVCVLFWTDILVFAHDDDACGSAETGNLVNPLNCAQYYDCSYLAGDPISMIDGEEHLRECPYPMLFDSESLECERYDEVDCGMRYEPVFTCEYYSHNCQGRAHCRPCKYNFADCRNQGDGDQPWRMEGFLSTPHYAVCKNGRTMEMKMCNPQLGFPGIFDPNMKKCRSIFDISNDDNGMMPDCTGLTNGRHPLPESPCTHFFVCRRQQYRRTKQCHRRKVFDESSRRCKFRKFVCDPCGTIKDCSTPS